MDVRKLEIMVMMLL